MMYMSQCLKNACDINALMPRQNGRLFADEVCKCILFNENIWISITISQKFSFTESLINNITATIGSDNDLVLTRRQAIIWTNDG